MLKKHKHEILSYNIKSTRILSLEGITRPVLVEELYKKKPDYTSAEKSNLCDHIDENFSIEDKSLFGNIECEKKYFFQNGKLRSCNFVKHEISNISQPRKMYEAIVKINWLPDIINFDKSAFLLQCVWNGCNGTIVFNLFYGGTIVIVFDLKD